MTIETKQPEAVFMMGGPGAGKGYVRKRMFADLPVVDADSWKARHPEYDPKNPSAIHDWSVTMATKDFFSRLGGTESFVYDGTGTNADRYVDWILKAQSAGFRTRLVYVRTPLQVALKRNAERARTVPEEVVREKHAVIETSFSIVSGYADDVEVVNN